MDFVNLSETTVKTASGTRIDVIPNFLVKRSKDLMIRAKDFYAMWDEERNIWTTDEYEVALKVDQALAEHLRQAPHTSPRWMHNFSSNSWKNFQSYLSNLADNSKQLDEKVVFLNTPIKKSDYISKRLPYELSDGDMVAYEEIVTTLYNPEERAKLEWAIGAIIAGDAPRIQKFLVLYGDPGTGKSTYINIIQQVLSEYYEIIEAEDLVGVTNAFATAAFKHNPLVAIQHDVDLSKVVRNSLLNSIVSHEEIIINEKNKPQYTQRVNSMLICGTNKPVKITDAKSGLIRRLIAVYPSGRLIPAARYHMLTSQVSFELGAVAQHCLNVYRNMGKDYYAEYVPIEMILETDIFYNFIETNYDTFKENDGVSLQRAWDLYKLYCDDSSIEYKLPKHRFREELRNYFREFHERITIDGERLRSVYIGFIREKFQLDEGPEPKAYSLVLDQRESLLDELLASQPAQYATELGTPVSRWSEVKTTLSDLDTTKIHYVKPPVNHIVIDFDLKDENGEKSAEANIAAASEWPSTYAEFSKSGAGVHLHYQYTGDATELSRVFDEGIEIKVFVGNASLRRMLTACNNVPVSTLSSGLPLKEKQVINFDTVKSERGLRRLIERNLFKEIHPGTKPSIDFIHKILDDAYQSGMSYDVTDMRPKIFGFAMGSTNQADYCMELVEKMKFASDETVQNGSPKYDSDKLVFFDIEVFPNLILVCWKYEGSDQVVRMFNPTSKEIEQLLRLKLVGYNNRRYDNHILYAIYMGYTTEEIYKLSLKLIGNERAGTFAEAYNLSYTDIYDFLSAGNKKSLKRWQIDLGIAHKELGLDWNEPVPPELWEKVAEYCDNDVISEEVVFNHNRADFVARQILADLSGLTVNDTTNKHSTVIMFGREKNPQSTFVYTELNKRFPGYVYDFGKSYYRDELVGEGGYVYAEPGMYTDVAVLDVASMHPTSIEQLNLFGEYTKRFSDIKNARVLIKREDLDGARKMLGGKLSPYLSENADLKGLSDALKTVINSVYGLTSASFDNAFRDPRNKDNIVAKRGALFMIDLKHAVQERGFIVAHIKTDSIKIPNATPEIIQFVMDFGKAYGYEFEHETTYERICLVNDAVFIAKDKKGWHATGSQFQHPYVFKTLFTHEKIEFPDLCETKTVTTALYLDFDSIKPMWNVEDGIKPQFIGRAGSFCPVKDGCGGGLLLREKDGKYYAASGTKGYLWMEAEMVKTLEWQNKIDMRYFMKLADEALAQLMKYGDADWFLSDETQVLAA